MTIGVCGPVDLKMLNWDHSEADIPHGHAVPLTTYFVNGLLKRGYKVIVYTNSTEIEEPLVLKTEQVTVCVGRQKPQPGRRFFQYEVKELQQLIKENPCDFISAFWSYEYAWAALRSGIPTVVSLHDVALQILLQHKDMFRLVRWAINYIVVTKAKHLIANSSYTYNMLDRGTRKKTRIINNFFTSEMEEILPPPSRKGNYITSVAMGFSHRKNIETALQAFAIVRKQHPELEYHLLGADMEPGGLAQQYARQHNLEKGVKFIGLQPYNTVLETIANAKLLLHTAREESFGMVLLEAMVAKTPVIGGNSSGYIPTLLDNGNAGLLCNINSPQAVAQCVLKLVEDEQLGQQLVETAYSFAHNNYSEDVVIQQHLACYADILGKPIHAITPPAAATKPHPVKL
ncbi:glycosyltransferase family 1 protein [Pontibacter diazotrophicus]|uniref:Glycosyltransferase family 1 protein n=2 Tax=Pontibacter diazotrophicus TaxID=1400979 RepID=A0A3D8L8K3_9BACT|nr:glycosyltransferase family 1 protein [Pontibacter diazotrophicus]